jgi:hypothetical protein
LGDPFLWPQVWDENRYVLDSHWIYPGDPLVIPGRPTVVPEEGPPPVAETPPPPEPEEEVAEAEAVEPERVVTPQPPPMVLVASPSDVYCSGYIDPDHEYSNLWVGGTDEPIKQALGQGDVIYLTQGRNQGIQPGAEYAVIRKTRDVRHPTTGQMMGEYIRRMGRARVMLVQEDTSTAVLEMSCSDIHLSDELVPWHAIPIPQRSAMPPFERYDVTPSGGPDGQIVAITNNLTYAAAGHIIYTDLGLASGVKPGDVLTVFRARKDLPRTNMGQAIVLTVEPTTSSAMIQNSVRETTIGDWVEIVR